MLQQLDYRGLDRHVKLVGVLVIIGEIIPMIFAAAGIVFLLTIGAISDDPDAMAALTAVGGFAMCTVTLFALPGLIAGLGLLRRQSWARYLALIVSFFNLIWFPIGTLISLYTIYVLLQEAAPHYFDSGRTEGGLPVAAE